jgi:hypothetical protein
MMIIPTRTDDTITGIVSPYDSSDCIICSSGYDHHDINNVSSIFLVKSALMIPVIVSSVVVGIIIMTLIMFPITGIIRADFAKKIEETLLMS